MTEVANLPQPDPYLTDRIHPPILDQFGNVTEVGWIDLNDTVDKSEPI